MALPPPDIIRLAKYYAHQMSLGRTAYEIGQFLKREYAASQLQVERARYQAQRAVAVGTALGEIAAAHPEALGEHHLSEALEGKRRPAETVGVSVMVLKYQNPYDKNQITDWYSLYIEERWDATLQDVVQRAREWIEQEHSYNTNLQGWEIRFQGPTLWPGASPGLGMGG